MEFSGRTAMITGGASGMGLLSGEKLAEQGANVALLDVNEEALAKAEEKIKEYWSTGENFRNLAKGIAHFLPLGQYLIQNFSIGP